MNSLEDVIYTELLKLNLEGDEALCAKVAADATINFLEIAIAQSYGDMDYVLWAMKTEHGEPI